MPELVYIKGIHPRSFLHLSTSGESFCLRDFSSRTGPVVEVARQTTGRTTSTIRALVEQHGNFCIPVAERAIKDYAYWHEQTLEMNGRYLAKPKKPWWILVANWLAKMLEKVAVPVIVAVLIAAILAWLGLKK